MNCTDFHKKLYDFFCEKKYCDITITVQHESFLCHHVVFAAMYKDVENMFGCHFEKVDNNNYREFVVHDIDRTSFLDALRFMYSAGKCGISERKTAGQVEQSTIRLSFNNILRIMTRKRIVRDLHTKLDDCRYFWQYCDVKVRVEGKSFRCHRVVLAASSNYFNVLFGGYFKKVMETVVHDIDVQTFRNVLQSLYSRRMCKITVRNIQKLLHASALLQIHSIEECCAKFILDNLSHIHNIIIDIFILARAVNVRNVVSVLMQHIIKNLKIFYEDQSFMAMPFDDLKCIIVQRYDRLYYKDEKLLFDLFFRWVHHSPKERRKYFDTLATILNLKEYVSEKKRKKNYAWLENAYSEYVRFLNKNLDMSLNRRLERIPTEKRKEGIRLLLPLRMRYHYCYYTYTSWDLRLQDYLRLTYSSASFKFNFENQMFD